jgi:myosin heavy subunit
VHQLKGERSYHIFYQLVRGTKDKVQREALRLPGKPSDFAYLAKSGCTVRDAAPVSSSRHSRSNTVKLQHNCFAALAL